MRRISRIAIAGLFVAVLGLAVVGNYTRDISADVRSGGTIRLSAVSGDSQVRLSWTGGPTSTNIRYELYRRQGPKGEYIKQTDALIRKNSFHQYGLVNHLPYSYKVRPVIKRGNKLAAGAFSAPITVTASPVQPVALTDSNAPRYYIAPNGSDTNSCTATAPCRQLAKALMLARPNSGTTIVVGNGTSANPAVYDGFKITDFGKGATEVPSRPVVIEAGGPNISIRPTPNWGINISVERSAGLTFNGFTIMNAPRYAVRILDSTGISVRNSTLGNCGRTCILTARSNYVIIEDNATYGAKEEHGIYVSESSDHQIIRRNKTYNNKGAGIQINAETLSGPLRKDGVTRHVLIESNVIGGNGNGINLLAVQNTTVVNNLLFDNIYTGIANARENTNVAGPANMMIAHNTVIMPADGRYALQFRRADGKNMVHNNIFSHPKGKLIEYVEAKDRQLTDSSYNVFIADQKPQVNESNSATGTSLGQIIAKPTIFTGRRTYNWNAFSWQDFTLSTASLAKDQGTVDYALPADITGKNRPASKVDSGALEL